jgi:hypothetical protein
VRVLSVGWGPWSLSFLTEVDICRVLEEGGCFCDYSVRRPERNSLIPSFADAHVTDESGTVTILQNPKIIRTLFQHLYFRNSLTPSFSCLSRCPFHVIKYFTTDDSFRRDPISTYIITLSSKFNTEHPGRGKTVSSVQYRDCS